MSTTSRRKKKSQRAKQEPADLLPVDINGIVCPFCAERNCRHDGDRRYYYPDCKKLFDDEPEEGGDYSQFDPTWRIARRERTAKHGRNRSGY